MIYVTFCWFRNSDTQHFLWCRKTPFKQRRLDFFLVSENIQENVQSTDTIPSVGSDHSAIKIKLCSLKGGSKGQGYWKFNTSLIEDQRFPYVLKNRNIEISMGIHKIKM